MMHTYWIRYVTSVLFAALVMTAAFNHPLNADEQDYYYRLKKSWKYLQNVYEQLNKHYVEEIDPYNLIKAGIEGMLDELDPYTVFIEEEGQRRLKIITTGKYGGLGMEIGLRNKNVTIIAPIGNSPAKRKGLQAGDIIRAIDGQEITGWSVNKVSSKLRGKIGTEVTLKIERPGLSEPFELTLERSEIVVEDIGYAGFLSNGTGYISLTGFTDKAADELRDSIRALQKKGDLNRLILDLRGNPGGLLDAAVEVVNVFVPKNELVVYTKGYREEEYKFRTRRQPLLPQTPLVVMVDEGSASASEIVAGALQDMDRAVIVGQPTFGKGLVQKVFDLDKYKEAKLKVTTAKYYVPSGRCIQKKDYGFDNNVIIRDSLREEAEKVRKFFTRNDRPVYDKGGIYPDISVESDSMAFVTLQLLRKNVFFNFAVAYHQEHPTWDDSMRVDKTIIKRFKRFLEKEDIDLPFEGMKELNDLKKIADRNNHSKHLEQLLTKVDQAFQQEQMRAFEEHSDEIKRILRLELIEKYLGRKARHKFALERDKQVTEALSVLNDQIQYKDILAIQ